MSKLGIINYGVGNIRSVKNSLDYLNIPNKVISKPDEIKNCDKIILPGVGAFGPAMEKLNRAGFTEKLLKFSKEKPVLGICLGMQLLFDESEEYGKHNGLGLLKGKVVSFHKKIKKLPIPLIVWNGIKKKRLSPILKGVEDDTTFYFIHSFDRHCRHGFYCGWYCNAQTKRNCEYLDKSGSD